MLVVENEFLLMVRIILGFSVLFLLIFSFDLSKRGDKKFRQIIELVKENSLDEIIAEHT